MRESLALLLVTGILSGCAGTAMQTQSPTSAPDAPAEAAGTPGGTAEPEVTLSSAGLALLEQGRAQRAAGEYPQASASLERALRVDPQQPSIWLELGILRFDEGDFAQAEQMARKALSLSPETGSIQAQAAQLIEQSRRAAGR